MSKTIEELQKENAELKLLAKTANMVFSILPNLNEFTKGNLMLKIPSILKIVQNTDFSQIITPEIVELLKKYSNDNTE